MELVSHSCEVTMSCLSYSYCKISRCSLHSLFSHIYEFNCIVVPCSWLNLYLKFFRSTHKFSTSTSFTLSPNNFSFSFTSRALFIDHIIVSSSYMYSFNFFTLPLALTTPHNVILVLCTWAQTMRTGHSFKNSRLDNFPLIEILECEYQRDLKISPLKFMKIDLILNVRVHHFLPSYPIIKILGFLIGECLIS